MVGASGFEPPTSWSRTSGQNHISRCPGVTYRFSGWALMDKFGQVIRARASAPRSRRGPNRSHARRSPYRALRVRACVSAYSR